jgi:hypothetical protein
MYVGAKVNAKLIKLETADGAVRVEVPQLLGRVFQIYPGTVEMRAWKHRETGVQIAMVSVFMEAEKQQGWFPIELLEVEWN